MLDCRLADSIVSQSVHTRCVVVAHQASCCTHADTHLTPHIQSSSPHLYRTCSRYVGFSSHPLHAGAWAAPASRYSMGM